MAGQRCSRMFWDEITDPSGATGTVCKSGGKKRSLPRRSFGSGQNVEKKEVNRDRTVMEADGDVKRYVWDCPIGSYDRDERTLKFRDCGWQTKLTKERLNQVLPGGRRISQQGFEWKVDGDDWDSPLVLDMDEITMEAI